MTQRSWGDSSDKQCRVSVISEAALVSEHVWTGKKWTFSALRLGSSSCPVFQPNSTNRLIKWRESCLRSTTRTNKTPQQFLLIRIRLSESPHQNVMFLQIPDASIRQMAWRRSSSPTKTWPLIYVFASVHSFWSMNLRLYNRSHLYWPSGLMSKLQTAVHVLLVL